MSQDELFEQADLVGEAEIAKIDWSKDKEQPHVAHLRFSKILKGEPRYPKPLLARLRIDRRVNVKMRRIKRDVHGKPLAGQWSDGYRVGDHVMTHLVWDNAMDGYRTIWWNAVWQAPRRSG
jgi:hypothetical protein